MACLPIPEHSISQSDLEVIWPETQDTGARLCYCPPFEGEEHLFSRCIATTSCDTSYSIEVVNNSHVCLYDLSAVSDISIPMYFTLLMDHCSSSPHTCIIRSIVTSYLIITTGKRDSPYNYKSLKGSLGMRINPQPLIRTVN